MELAGSGLGKVSGPWQVAGPGRPCNLRPWLAGLEALAGLGRSPEKPASNDPVFTRFFVGFKGIIIQEAVRLVNPCRLDKGSARPRKLTLPGQLEDRLFDAVAGAQRARCGPLPSRQLKQGLARV